MRTRFKTLCVFCASSDGHDPAFALAATLLGQTLARRGITLVYGGGCIGLMGTVADAALAAGGKVIGVIPGPLMNMEVGHAHLTKLHVVASMHERKQMMADLSDGFITLPGGFGTLEELAEIVTWSQLGIHHKPMGILGSVSKRLILPIVLPDDMEVDRHDATRTHGRAMGIDPALRPV